MAPNRTREIELSELASHSSKNDAWIAIRGKVFNCTAFIDKHPGGVANIMKGVGKDATSTFDKAHSYVFYENILGEQQVGVLKGAVVGTQATSGKK